MNEQIIDVNTGEVKVSAGPAVLRALALGSCVAVVAYDSIRRIGGLAHIMLPGGSPEGKGRERIKYTEDALDELFEELKKLGAKREDLKISLVGGADLLGNGNISELMVNSVLNYLERLRIAAKEKSLGGTQYRSVSLDIASGKILCREGDSIEKEW